MSGRKATTDIIPGRYILSVGRPNTDLPKNWSWVLLSDVATLATGHTPSRKKPEYWKGEIPWMAVGDARKVHGKTITETKEYTNQLGIDNSAAVLLPAGTVCLSRTASIGYSVILGKEMATSQGFVNWICSDLLNPRYLQLIFMVENQFLNELAEGIAHTTIYFPEVKAFNIGLPPKNLQDSICEKVNRLFFQLDEVKKRLETIPELLKNFRRAVLNKAVTGKLTEEWRKGKSLKVFELTKPKSVFRSYGYNLPQNWEVHSFESVANINSNLKDPNEYLDYILVAPNHIEKNTGVLSEIEYTKDIMPKSGKHFFKKGSIVYSKIRPYLNKLILADFEGLCSADMYPITAEINQKYLFYYMLSSVFLTYSTTAGERSVLPKINQKGLNNIPVPVPSIMEQTEIVKRIESLFLKADQIQLHYEKLINKIENLPQAILQKAFKGELVEHLPTDSDAKALLEEIKELKQEVKLKKRKK